MQHLNLAFQRGVSAFHIRKLAQCALHLALLFLELPPVLVTLDRRFSTQQDVFPLLNLNLELQIGVVNQLRRPNRTVKKAAVGLYVIGKEVEAGQRNDQHKHKAAAKQTKDLKPKGFGHRDDLWIQEVCVSAHEMASVIL
ncbi:hypothetical protein [Pseudomonas syringae]|uniref:hypothetical protein n=1 Tax=Pseudomonas syringae TaxID=317 RepID=UPI003AF2B743